MCPSSPMLSGRNDSAQMTRRRVQLSFRMKETAILREQHKEGVMCSEKRIEHLYEPGQCLRTWVDKQMTLPNEQLGLRSVLLQDIEQDGYRRGEDVHGRQRDSSSRVDPVSTLPVLNAESG
eukprot:GHVU01127308.1.p1 GENE.GHVU01127308.1~~GHVU01127308.1.p1  ORF type:complete len:121 (-),score=9.51 GHVU01127308.1:947-1309(-)